MTVYVDGVFEHSYVRINDNVDNNRNYNTLHVLDASSRIATLRVGKDSQDSTPELKYYVEDHLGNSSVSVQSNGNRINLEEYYPFGETSFGSFAKKRYRYNGKEKDEHTGLYEYGQRYYAPWLCRFISVDPVAEKFADLSSYNYAGNRPITKRDQEGLQEEGRKESPKGGDNGKKQSKEGGEKDSGGEPINIAPLPDNVQQEIDDAMARAKESGNDIEINVDQTKDGYSVTINEGSQLDAPESQDLELPKDPELAIRDQQNELESNQSPERQEMDPIPSKPAGQITPDDGDNTVRLIQTIVEGYVDKTKSLMKKGGKQLAKAAKFFGKVSKGLGWFGLGTAGYDAYNEINEKGLTWKTATKATIGVGLALGSIFFAPLAIPAFIYGVADYFGLVDKALDGIETVIQKTGDFFQEVAYKTKKGFYDLERGLRNGWRPVW